MFDIFAKLLSSIASFLFPLFASYKALKTSDPAELTPWLMYWVVLACALLVESWTDWFLVWVPFYAYIRLIFLLYLVLPQTQGARIIYQTHIHPYLEENESKIEEFISSAHERLKNAGLAYLKQAISLLKTKVLGLPEEEPAPTPAPAQTNNAQSYTQSLLSRFSLPAARWAGAGIKPPGGGAAGAAGADVYNFLASALLAAMPPGFSASGGDNAATAAAAAAANRPTSRIAIPDDLRGADRVKWITAQREKLNVVLEALERETKTLDREDTIRPSDAAAARSPRSDVSPPDERPPSGLSSWSGLSKSRSEVDFEKIDVDSATEEEANLRQRPSAGSWIPWGWGSGGAPPPTTQGKEQEQEQESTAHSSGVQKSPQ